VTDERGPRLGDGDRSVTASGVIESLPAPLAVERLGRQLAAVPRGKLREAYLVRGVGDAPITSLVQVLACAQREAVRGVLEARVLVETFTDLAHSGGLDEGLVAALYTAAVMLSEPDIIPLFAPEGANDNGEAPKAPRKGNSLADSGETLGRRKTLARTASGDVLLRILEDPHAEVIRNAMLNPVMTEALAVRVAARRPVPPEVLAVVGKSRFGNRHAVRRALALNPACPAKLACRIVSTMTATDLEDVAQTRDLAPEVSNAAKKLLQG
jgi:hypothetical protein